MAERNVPQGVIPDLKTCGKFGGDESAARWIARLKWEFKRAGYPDGQLPASSVLQAVDMQCVGEAATFLDSSSIVRVALDRAQQNVATSADLQTVETALKDQFPAKLIDNLNDRPVADMNDLSQQEDEPLAAYYTRAVTLLRRMGARDLPRDPAANLISPMTPLEMNMLQTLIAKFVDGLRDLVLRREVIDKNGRNSPALWAAHEVIQNCQHIIDEKAAIEKSNAEAMRHKMMEKYITDQTGLPLDQALLNHYPPLLTSGLTSLPNSWPAAPFGMGSPYGVYSGFSTYIHPSSALGNPSFSSYRQQPAPVQQQPAPVQQQSAPVQQQSAPLQQQPAQQSAPPQQPVFQQPPQQQSSQQQFRPPAYRGQGSDYNRATRGGRGGRGGFSQTTRSPPPRVAPVGNSNSTQRLPPRETSTHPLVNGTRPLPSHGRVCFSCGEPGHFSPNCTAEKRLQPWETAYIKALVYPRPDAPNAPVQGQLDSKSAELFFEHYEQTQPGFAESLQADDLACQRAAASTSTSGDSTPIFTPTSSGHLSPPIPQINVQDFDSHSLSVELDDATSASEWDDDLREEVCELACFLSSAAEPAVKKRKGAGAAMPIRDLLNATPLPAVKAKKQKRRKGLQEIYARKGEGPFDFQKLAKSIQVNLSLVDLFQISPECAKQFRHLSTRRNAKTERRMMRKLEAIRGNPTLSEPSRSRVPVAAPGAAPPDTDTNMMDLHSAMASATDLVPIPQPPVRPAKAYRMSATLKFKRGNEMYTSVLPEDSVQADQGSDVNLMSTSAADKLGLKRRSLKDLGFARLNLITSDGRSTEMKEFVLFIIGVQGIWRSAWCLLRPHDHPGDCMVLLGLPWLWDVVASFDIRQSSLMIGDTVAGESRVELKGPLLSPYRHHKIALHPSGPGISPEKHLRISPQNNVVNSDLSDDENSSNSDSDSGN